MLWLSMASMVWADVRIAREFVIRNPLVTALSISLVIHLALFGGWRVGKHLGWWQHQATWLLQWNKKKVPVLKTASVPQPLAARQKEIPLTFVEVDPTQATPEPPKEAKHYGVANTKAANPDAVVETPVPKLEGQQDKVPRLVDNPKPQPFPLQPSPPPEPAKPLQEPPPRPKTSEPPGDLAKLKPADIKPNDAKADAVIGETPVVVPERPRTLAAARQQRAMLAGDKMKQEGGVKQRGRVSLDVKATPFGAYDAEFIAAVQQRWYNLLESTPFAQRAGKVVLDFRLNYDGRITDMKAGDNDAGELLGLICQKAVLDPAPYRPWPSDMRRLVGANYREVTFTFYYNY